MKPLSSRRPPLAFRLTIMVPPFSDQSLHVCAGCAHVLHLTDSERLAVTASKSHQSKDLQGFMAFIIIRLVKSYSTLATTSAVNLTDTSPPDIWDL